MVKKGPGDARKSRGRFLPNEPIVLVELNNPRGQDRAVPSTAIRVERDWSGATGQPKLARRGGGVRDKWRQANGRARVAVATASNPS